MAPSAHRPNDRFGGTSAVVLLCLFTWHLLGAKPTSSAEPAQSAQPPKVRPDDPYTRQGFEHFYNNDYDSAIQDFERAEQAHSNDPFAVNHLLEAVLVREIDRVGALTAEQYMDTEFLRSKKAPADPQVRARVEELITQALDLSEQELKEKPDDADALYARGVTRSLSAMYEGLVDKAWYSAFRNALGAYRDHKRVLELSPNYNDAKLVIGVYEYIVAALPVYDRWAAYLFSVKGSKSEGIEDVRQAANAGGDASLDAKTALALFLVREHQYPEALSQIRELYRSYPHNFHYALSEADVLRASGDLAGAESAYRNILVLGRQNMFPHARLARAAFNLGRTLESRKDYRGAADAFDSAAQMPGTDHDQAARADLLAGEMYDLLHERDSAVRRYEEVLSISDDSNETKEARDHLKHPYH